MSKILLLIDALVQGGAERQMVYLASQLSEAGNEVRLIKFYSDQCAYSDILTKAAINIETNISGNNRWRRIYEIYKTVREWHPDLTIAYKNGACIAACIARLFTKFRLVVSERNTTQVLNLSEKLKFQTYRLANYIVPNSYTQTKLISTHFPYLSDKVVPITNMIDTNRFHPAEIIPVRKRVILTARISPQKNVLMFLKALEIAHFHPDEVHFDWFGRIQNKTYFEEIVELQRRLNLMEIITFHTDGSDNIEEEYRKSTHFCLPSVYEGFPNVLCEAMASGLVCYASNVCDNPIILNNREFLFNPNNPEEIAEILKRMFELSPLEIHTIRQANRKRIVDLCSPEAFTDKYLALLK